MNSTEQAIFTFVGVGPEIGGLDDSIWDIADDICITNYWSDEVAPKGRHAAARLLWSNAAIHVRFNASVAEPLVASGSPDTSKKAIGLWDRDVCEIFVAPDKSLPNRYFEFEAAPTGEWLDVAIEMTPKERISDWNYASGMSCSARIEERRVLIAMEIPWNAFGKVPANGDLWLGNLFRCVGTGAERGYLSWKPTKTEQPNFHVPAAFGEFIFVK